jgi:hypothetical protein
MSDSGDDGRERKPRKARKKKRIPGLPNEVIVIKNMDKDKGWGESWDYPKKRSPGHLPHPFRLLALGGVGRGKTNCMKQIFLRHQSSGRKFKKLYILTCDPSSKEWVDCCPDLVTDQMLDLEDFDPTEKTCIILDDFEWEGANKADKKALSTLFRFISSHRNVSVMVGYQSFFDTPSIARKCANSYLIYKPNSRVECTNIENRCGLDKGTLKSLFKGNCKGTYDSVMVDRTVGTPYPLRKNIYQPIEVEDSDSE